MTIKIRTITGILASALALASCGNEDNATAGYKEVYSALASVTKARKSAGTATGGAPANLVGNALSSIKGPVLIALTHGGKNTAAMGEFERNGSYQTFTTVDRQTLILKQGVLTGTRGLGEDLMSSEADASIALIRGRRSGTTTRTYRYLDGLGQERPLRLDCKIAPAGSEPVTNPAGGSISTTKVGEVCTAGGLKVTNIYWVGSDGFVWQSRQWVGPEFGDVALQHLRR
ncbi:YjbF family lipoprotein [Alphaproteobacteria bacterium KMM 3653]|uniref:YjbF family lipoprotein n=1 Tax=Harenicola maris TaxID=2841044 RepID=A0AAP2CSM5_9RHOB|nr:YjbF family lipoprotein [Harenicola maris]